MNRRPDPALPVRASDSSQLIEWLALRHRALCLEWRLCARQDRVDDDLLPARQRLEDALVEVDMALDRVQSGSYGRCVSCSGRIDFQRLLAHPAAARCWPCQQSAEALEAEALTH